MKFEKDMKSGFEYDCKETTAMDDDSFYNGEAFVSDTKKESDYDPNSCWNRFTSCLRSIWATKHTEDTKGDRQLFIKTTLRELVIYLLFLIILMIIAFGMTTMNGYQFTNLLKNLFTNSPFNDISGKFSGIATEADFWKFLSGPLLNGLYWTTWYNNLNISTNEKNFIHYENKLIGLPRLRQLRVGNKSCSIPPDFQADMSQCFAPYSSSSEFKDPFKSSNDTVWTYTDESKLNAGSYQGKEGSYGGGGYYVDLTTTYEGSAAIIKSLFNGLWVDKGTRVVLIDFTVYNANINLFCIIKLCLEFPPTGGVVPSNTLRTVKLVRYVTSTDFFVMACEFILIIFLLYYFIEEALEIRMVGCEYFCSIWNILDIMVICFCMISSIFNVYRTVKVKGIIEDLISNDYQYSNFESLSYWQLQFNHLMAITLFLAWVKIFKYISFNKTMTQLSSTLGHCSKDLAGFAIMFFIIFLAFAQLGYLIFGSQVEDFCDVETSIYTLFRIILGDFDFNQLEMAHRILGPLYFVFYVFVVFFVLFNMFLAIINDTYAEVKEEIAKQKNDFEISDYLKERTDTVLTKLHLKREKVIDLQDAMIRADKNKDGVMDFEEWKGELKARGFADAEIEAVFSRHDVDGNRILDKAEQDALQKELENEKLALNDEISLENTENAKRRMEEPEMNSVSIVEYRALSRRVERMDTNTRSIISNIDCVLESLENMEKSKASSREAMGIILKTLTSSDEYDEDERKQKLEKLIQSEITKLNQTPMSRIKSINDK